VKTVLAHGCFDLLHLGHIRHLKEARELGDRLVVSVTSDKFVNKGPGRPRFTDTERAEALLELRCVDEVKINDGADAVEMIKHVKPSIYVKGIDYRDVDNDPRLRRETEAINELHGDMVFTSTRKWSSTQLLIDTLGQSPYADYLDVLRGVECDVSFSSVLDLVLSVRANRHRLLFVGNGGSAAIASHMAADFQKAGAISSLCFNDGPQVTAIANDIEYEEVFAQPIRYHGRDGDVLFAISSSGESGNIIRAVEAAKGFGLKVVTFSGFDPQNAPRKLGHANFYVPSRRYGVVETAHLAIVHSLLDAAVELL